MKHLFDITNPTSAYEWLYANLNIKPNIIEKEYLIECSKDSMAVINKHISDVEDLDIDNLDFITFHVTTNNDKCQNIKRYGIRNLQWVLTEETPLKNHLLNYGIKFDVAKEILYIGNKEYNIHYERNINSDAYERVKAISHKIYKDYQINSFFYCKDIDDYSKITEKPEFMYNLSHINRTTNQACSDWTKLCETYVIKYKSKITDFDWKAIYPNEYDCLIDPYNNYIILKKWLCSKAVDSCFCKPKECVCAFMKPEKVVEPKNIIEIVTAEEWKNR